MISIQQNLNSGKPLTQVALTRELQAQNFQERKINLSTQKLKICCIHYALKYLALIQSIIILVYLQQNMTQHTLLVIMIQRSIKIARNNQELEEMETLELHAVKLISDIDFNHVNPILQECINQYNLMQFSKKKILNIVNIIQIKISNSNVDFEIPLELAEFSLYDYIQTNEISEEIYQQLTNILIDFLILLHTNNYDHRDIKPQNILYVKDVGWKLADFGESINYEESQGMYKIKGTLSFIPKDVRINSKQNKEILQDLFRNDVYATVCTFVMIKNPQFKSKDLEKFMQENQLDSICQRLINITQVEELHQFNQKNLLRFQYSGEPLQRREELIFYDLKLSIQRFKNLDKKLDDRIIQIIDTVLYKLKAHNNLVGYNKYVLLIIQNFPFSTDKFKNLIRLDHKDILKNPKKYFFNARNHQMYLFGRGLYKKLFDYYNIPSDSFNNMVIKLFQLILCNLFDEAKLQLNLIASKIYSESSQVNSDFLGFYNYLYFILHGEYPIIKVMSTKEIQKQQLVKELEEFYKKDLNQKDIKDYLNIKTFKPGSEFNFLALFYPLLPKFIKFRNQQIFDHIIIQDAIANKFKKINNFYQNQQKSICRLIILIRKIQNQLFKDVQFYINIMIYQMNYQIYSGIFIKFKLQRSLSSLVQNCASRYRDQQLSTTQILILIIKNLIIKYY